MSRKVTEHLDNPWFTSNVMPVDDFAFRSGDTKSLGIQDRFPVPSGGFCWFLFAFGPECELAAPQFALGDTNVGFTPTASNTRSTTA
jgi:hypothetical protein